VSVIVDLRFTRRETKGWTVGLKVAKIATQRPTAWTITMLDFNDFFYFVQVVDRGGFTARFCGQCNLAGLLLHNPSQPVRTFGLSLRATTNSRPTTSRSSSLRRYAYGCALMSPRPRSAPQHSRSNGSNEIPLPQFNTAMPQNVVSGGAIEIEVGHHEMH
jgi:hypothetical protein